MLLTEVIGLSWAKAHDEAEQLEHAISPEGKRFCSNDLGQESCPHGVPMRGGIAQLRKQGAVLLADLRAKDAGRILCVSRRYAQFLEFLEGLRLRPSPPSNAEARVRRNDDAAFQRETMAPRQACHQPHLGAATQFVEEAGGTLAPHPLFFVMLHLKTC